MAKTQSILTEDSLDFLERYLNNAAPTGYETPGQKLWMDYLAPYVDEFITDAYGSAVGVILFIAAIVVAIFYQRFFMQRGQA